MTDMKSAIQNSILPNDKGGEKKVDVEVKSVKSVGVDGENVIIDKPTEKKVSKKKKPVKRRRGRPSKVHKSTKLHSILEKRGLTRKDLYELIAKKYPEEPISPDAVSRIVSGSRVFYSTTTLFRICGALNITPNMALNWEEQI
jgi:DNA-binding Xre family transcriptional regulator